MHQSSCDFAELRNLMRSMDERLGAALDALRTTTFCAAEGGCAHRATSAATSVRDVVREIVTLWTASGLAARDDGFRAAEHDTDAVAAECILELNRQVPTQAECCGEQPLSTREHEVAGLVAAGLSNTDIADRLFISKRTVESHVDNVKLKLGFRTRHQIIAWVLHEHYTRRESPRVPSRPVPTSRARRLRRSARESASIRMRARATRP